MSEKKDIKEISELIDGLEAVGVPVAKVFADGKVNALDLPHGLELIQNHKKIIDAVQGIDEIVPEGKDIDPAEAVIIVQKLYVVANKIKEASKAI